MANDLTIFEMQELVVPDYLKDFLADEDNIKPRAGVPTLSYQGRKWSTIINGEKTTFMRRNAGVGFRETDADALVESLREAWMRQTIRQAQKEGFQRIAVEDLNVAGMVRHRSLARAIATSGWAEFRAQLAYKAQWYGRTLVVVDRYFPSSKTCSACGMIRAHLDLGTRAWSCPTCGVLHDRDLNAAMNLDLAAGRAVQVCGADVRPGHGTFRVRQLAGKQKSQVAKPGIPFL